MKFAPTVFSARQLINHGHITVNGKRVKVPSYQISEGDVVEMSDIMKANALVLEAVDSAEREVPDYIEVDPKAVRGTFVRTPSFADVPFPVQMEPNLVVEYYSR
jgi:small subunit ribosomal protein S4